MLPFDALWAEMQNKKLIRDKIPEILEGKGVKYVTHTAHDGEYWEMLKEKLTEEVKEFIEFQSEEELADILEVIDAICEFRRINRDELESLKIDKRKKR